MNFARTTFIRSSLCSSLRSSRLQTLAALPVSLCFLALTGCNDKQGEKADTRQTVSLPNAPKADAPAKKPAAVIPPPTEAEVGMPIYPGAKTYVNENGVPVPPQKDPAMPMALLQTPDALDSVVDFYKQRIKETDASGAAHPAEPREEKLANGKRKVSLSGSDGRGSVVVAQIREDNNKTVIELMRAQLQSGTSDQPVPTTMPPSGGMSGSTAPITGGGR